MKSYEEQYYDWLVSLVDGPENVKRYVKLLSFLNKFPFSSDVELDENRVEDAYQLREEFLESGLYSCDEFPFDVHYGTPSVFEVLVAIARRIDDEIMYDTRYGDRTSEWFWLMMDNLGLISETDNAYNERYVRNVVRKFVYREYRRNGKGALFPVADAPSLDIWGQMNAWFVERV